MKKFLFITDAISSLVEYKDTSVLMMQTAFENNISIYVCEIKDLFYSDNVVSTVCSKVNDPFKKSVPAIIMLTLYSIIILNYFL